MATFHFDLVSPEQLVFSGDVDQVDVPGAEGEFGVFADHAPFISALRPGLLTVHAGGQMRRLIVLGGFAEVSPGKLTVLADLASSVEEFDREMLARRIRELEERAAQMAQGSALDQVIERLDHFREIDRHLTGTAVH